MTLKNIDVISKNTHVSSKIVVLLNVISKIDPKYLQIKIKCVKIKLQKFNRPKPKIRQFNKQKNKISKPQTPYNHFVLDKKDKFFFF